MPLSKSLPLPELPSSHLGKEVESHSPLGLIKDGVWCREPVNINDDYQFSETLSILSHCTSYLRSR